MMPRQMARALLFGCGLALLAGCATTQQPAVLPPPVQCPTPAPAPVPPVVPHLHAADWSALPGWRDGEQLASWPVWLVTCSTLQHKTGWQSVCQAAQRLTPVDDVEVRQYFESLFNVYQSIQSDGTDHGLITGYYSPLLHGSLTRTAQFSVPLYAQPADLLTIDLSSEYPQLKGMRLRGRLQGNQIVPYWSRAQIDGAQHPLAGKELVWLDDPVEAFFLQIQGSGRIVLPDRSQITVGYADQNGYPYQAIGRVLVARGQMSADQLSMQSIRAWGAAHPDQLPDLLAQNPSYVFFRIMPDTVPLGALGVPVTGGYSIAVDPRAIPLGAPVWLATSQPESTVPLDRLVLAQDTGGAIRGNVRADVYFGLGNAAGDEAGKMKQQGQIWVLLPKGIGD